jgi:hypothetical protein
MHAQKKLDFVFDFDLFFQSASINNVPIFAQNFEHTNSFDLKVIFDFKIPIY